MSRSTPALAAALVVAAAVAAGCKAKPADHAAAVPVAQSGAPARGATPAPELPDPGAAPPGALPPAELETRSVAAMQQLGDTLASDANDCDRIAADLKVFVVENRPLLGQLLALQQHRGDDRRDDPRAPFARRPAAVAAGQKLQSALAMCASSPAVATVMKEFPEE